MDECIINLRTSDDAVQLVDNIDALLRTIAKEQFLAVKVFVLDPIFEELTHAHPGNNLENNNHCCGVCENGSDLLHGWGSQERSKPSASLIANTKNMREMFANFSGNDKVLSWPVKDTQGNSVVVYSMVLLKTSNSEILKNIESCTKHVSLAYTRVQEKIIQKQNVDFLANIGDIYDKDIIVACQKMTKKLSSLVNAECGTVLLVDKSSKELYTNALGDVTLLQEIRIEISGNCFANLFEKPEITCFDLNKDSRAEDFKCLKQLIEHFHSDLKLYSLLVAPAVDEDGDVVAFICLLDKGGGRNFTAADKQLLDSIIKHCVPPLKNGLVWKSEMLIKRRNERLLAVAENLFRSLDDLDSILRKIMEEARNISNAERCSLFLVDSEREELVAKVFDGETTKDDEDNDLRIPLSHGIAGHVATTGNIVNIPDAYSHPLFYREVDNQTGFKTKSILCFPIKDDTGVIGVAQLCNKRNGHCFTSFDEQLTQAFAIFCGLSLVQSLLYQKAAESRHRSQLANELMMYHMQISDSDIGRYASVPFPSKKSINENVDSFHFMPRLSLIDVDSINTVLFMFQDLGFPSRWKLREHTVVRFCLTVKRGYRDPPYHNWTHAWTVAHFCYLLMKNTDVFSLLKDIECFVLFVACLCHDLDHRGTTNSFQIASKSVLAALYSSDGSVMEKHHFAQAMHIINSEGCNVFETLSKKHYTTALDLMQMIIIATDLANHFSIIKDIEELNKTGYKRDLKRHRRLLLSLMMTSCDLSDQTKKWEGAYKVSDLLYAEFFNQGDMEKSLGYTPKEMMNREKASIPKLQVEFVSKVALPVYRLLSLFLPPVNSICDVMDENIGRWQELQGKENNKAK
eukprot:gene6925-7703_t